MGSFRGISAPAALIFAASPAFAEVCEKARPNWQAGTQATVFTEFFALVSTPPSLILIVLTALTVRFRSQWGGLLIVVLWSIWVSIVSIVGRNNEVQQMAIAEGCVGSPVLFIGLVAAICIALILYTAPLSRDDTKSQE